MRQINDIYRYDEGEYRTKRTRCLVVRGSVGIEVGMEVDVRTEIGLRLVVVSSFVH